MKVVAGIDIGNSTTEVVLLRHSAQGTTVIGSSRAMTRGVKGSCDSVLSAAQLVRRTAARFAVGIDMARVAPWQPVRTACRSVEQQRPDTGPLKVVARQATTAAGDGVGVGRPSRLDQVGVGGDPVVLLVGPDIGYAKAAQRINEAVRAGARVVGVLVERDEAVLITNRLELQVPVIDQVLVSELTRSHLIAVEARPAGRPLQNLSDPYWLASSFGLDSSTRPVQGVVHELQDASFAVVALGDEAEPAPGRDVPHDLVVWSDGSCEALDRAAEHLSAAAPGAVVAVEWVEGGRTNSDDLFAVSLSDIADAAHSRRGTLATNRIVTALLEVDIGLGAHPTVLEDALELPVEVVGSEAEAGRRGALSTPGLPEDAVVVDIGAGTIDLTNWQNRCVVAGAGEMLTHVTAEALGIPTGTAEYAKRGPALHVDAPQVVIDENGARRFVDRPAPGNALGSLCVQGPVGLVPFNRTLGLGEWRAWRTIAKTYTIGDNVARALRGVGGEVAASVVLVGGAAADDEAVAALSRSLPVGSTVGRGNVAGTLGHRFAVAYGLAQGSGAPR